MKQEEVMGRIVKDKITLREGLCTGTIDWMFGCRSYTVQPRSKDGKTHKAESGVALLAAMSKAPVVPTAIIGTNKIFQNGSLLPQLKIIFGEPIYFEGKHNDKEALAEFSQKIMEKIDNLIKIHSQV